MKTWNGKDLAGAWLFTYKVDGVCVIVTPGGETLSRAGKPLHNMTHLRLAPGTYEVFRDNWESTVSMVRTQNHAPVRRECMFALEPLPDPRLLATTIIDPTAAQIRDSLEIAIKYGYEGLVLRQGDKRLKVKPTDTHDVVVTGWVGGKGKHAGKMGALITERGKVGTGFTDEARRAMTPEFILGKVIEVECMSLTPAGKFRHPRFVRVRFDK